MFVEIFHTKELDEKSRNFSLKAKESLKSAVKANTASLRRVVAVVQKKMGGRNADSFSSPFAFMDPPLLCKARTEQS